MNKVFLSLPPQKGSFQSIKTKEIQTARRYSLSLSQYPTSLLTFLFPPHDSCPQVHRRRRPMRGARAIRCAFADRTPHIISHLAPRMDPVKGCDLGGHEGVNPYKGSLLRPFARRTPGAQKSNCSAVRISLCVCDLVYWHAKHARERRYDMIRWDLRCDHVFGLRVGCK